LLTAFDPVVNTYGEGVTHIQNDGVERPVELQYRDSGITMADTPHAAKNGHVANVTCKNGQMNNEQTKRGKIASSRLFFIFVAGCIAKYKRKSSSGSFAIFQRDFGNSGPKDLYDCT